MLSIKVAWVEISWDGKIVARKLHCIIYCNGYLWSAPGNKFWTIKGETLNEYFHPFSCQIELFYETCLALTFVIIEFPTIFFQSFKLCCFQHKMCLTPKILVKSLLNRDAKGVRLSFKNFLKTCFGVEPHFYLSFKCVWIIQNVTSGPASLKAWGAKIISLCSSFQRREWSE